MKPSVPYLPFLHQRLRDPEYALGYLNACLDDDDESVFLLALKDVATAHGGLAKLAKKAKMNREHLFRMLSKRGNPEMRSLQKIAGAFGWKIEFVEKKDSKLKKAA